MKTSAVYDQIKMRLIQDFAPVFIEVTDDSARHQGHQGARAGGNSHFRVRMASDVFKGQLLVKRHQAVYRALDDFLKNGVHALQMELWSAEEWHARGKD